MVTAMKNVAHISNMKLPPLSHSWHTECHGRVFSIPASHWGRSPGFKSQTGNQLSWQGISQSLEAKAGTISWANQCHGMTGNSTKYLPIQSHPVLPYHDGGSKRFLSCHRDRPDIIHSHNYLHSGNIILHCFLKPETQTSQYSLVLSSPRLLLTLWSRNSS